MKFNQLNETTYSPVILNYAVVNAYGLNHFNEYITGCKNPKTIASNWWYSFLNSMTKGALNRAMNLLRDAKASVMEKLFSENGKSMTLFRI